MVHKKPRSPKSKVFFITSKGFVKNKDGKERVPISSPNFDRDRDRMTDNFLTNMVDQINNRHVSLWFDHGWGPNGYYSALDKLGFWDDAVIEDGFLYALPVLSDAKTVAKSTAAFKDMMESNTPVTFSIGFSPSEWEENDQDGLDFKDGDLYEASAVGLPCNADAVSSMSTFKNMVNFMSESGAPMPELQNIFKSLFKNEDETMGEKKDKKEEEEEEEEEDEDENDDDEGEMDDEEEGEGEGDDEGDDDEEDDKSVETLEEALAWVEENAPDGAYAMITDAIKEADEEEEDEEDKGEDGNDDEEEEDEDKGDDPCDDDDDEKDTEPKSLFKILSKSAKPKGHSPKGPAKDEPKKKSLFKTL